MAIFRASKMPGKVLPESDKAGTHRAYQLSTWGKNLDRLCRATMTQTSGYISVCQTERTSLGYDRYSSGRWGSCTSRDQPGLYERDSLLDRASSLPQPS